VLELARTSAAVITCMGTKDAVDAGVALGRAYAIRVAPDEVMLIDAPDHAAERCAEATTAIRAIDPDALVADASDGWTAWTLRGDPQDLDRAMARLTALELPGDGQLQGDVTRVPCKLIVAPGLVHLFVPAMWEAYLRERILARCASLDITERGEPAPWEAPS
jgi:hypothetical protein